MVRVVQLQPARKFSVGNRESIEISHVLNIELLPDEQITFLSETQQEYDFVRKEWGYYTTPSINNRLKRNRYKTALVKNATDHIYVMAVDVGQMEKFRDYLAAEKNEVLFWLDDLNVRQPR